MKTKFIHFGKRTLSVVLSIMMIVSTMLIGTITSVSAAFIESGAKVYFDNSKTQWADVHMYVYQGSLESPSWTVDWDFAPISGSNYYECTVDGYDTNAKYIFYDGSSKEGANRTVEISSGPQTSWWATCFTPSSLNTNWTGDYKAVGVKNVALSNNNTTTTGGTGTSSDPYIVSPGTNISVKASAELISTGNSSADSSGKKQYSFSVNGGSATTYNTTETYTVVSSAVAGTTYSVNADIRSYYNDSVLSDSTSTDTLYFKTESYYVYLKNQANWTNVYAFFKDSSSTDIDIWPGTAMEFLSDLNLFRIAIPSNASTLIFNNGNKGSGNQYPTSGTGFSVSSNIGKIFNNSNGNWFSVDTTAKYSIIGPVVNDTADDWSSTKSVDTTVDDFGTHSVDVELTNVANGYFRIKDSSTTYGPYNLSDDTATDYDLLTNTNTSITNPYEAHTTYRNKAFKISETGKYRIYVRDAYHENNRPDVWVVRTGNVEVPNPKITFGVYGVGGSLTAQSGGNTIFSDSTVTSGSSVIFTASPTDSNYTVEGWYSNADCTSDSKIIDAGTSTSYTISNVTSDTTVYVKFTSTSQPVASGYYYQKYVLDTYMVTSGDKVELTQDSTGEFAYTKITASGENYFLISTDTNTYYNDGNIYKNSIADPNLSSEDFIIINNHNANIDESTNKSFAKTSYTGDLYLIVYYPSTAVNTTTSPIVVATTTLPGSSGPSGPDTYKVTMNQGIQSRRDSQYLGTSYLDGDSAKIKNVSKDINDLTVTFTTETVNVANPTYNDLSLGYTGYMYQVYGYSINMTLDNGDDTTSTRVASVVNSLVDNNSAKPISALANGVYTCEYTFPSNIKSATVTPIFSVSADYAKAKGISYTAVYLKMTPGSNLFSNTYEPNYYTWRAEKSNDDGNPMFIKKGDKVLEREPEGNYGGQKMLYIGNNMYVAYVQSDLYGILFDDHPNSNVQTFDYNEFIKLQQLGYNNITFEPKGDGSSETVASGLNTTYASNGTKVYTDSDQSSQTAITISDTALNNEFELDVDIEGYYIDVFGNRLQDTSGKDIKRSDLLAAYSPATVKDELNALLAETGKSNELFGARYGDQDRRDTAKDYGMQYAIYNYYVDGFTKKLISQQVSGYGTIEGAVGPNSSSMTNAAYMASLGTPMKYRVGTAESNTVNNFATGYELISSKYAGVPYLVSYKLKSDGIRVDGKWYYMSRTPQVTVNVKASLLNSDGTLNMAYGKIVENTAPGSATVNYKSSDTIDQGTSAVMRATPNDGYAFVGFYEENGDFISKYNPYGNKVFAVDTTVYAVFKEVAGGSVTITNSPYDSALSNPTPGGGTGKISVTLVITPLDHNDAEGNPVYSSPVTYTGETSVSATIKDGDKFHIILTGERSGADNFLAFRIPDKDIYGNLYYVALNDAYFLDVTKDDNGKAISATYTTDDLIWNWNEQLGTTVTSETKKAKTFSYYTDFSKTDINATLEYKYQDRLGKWKTYIVKNVPMDVAEINKGNYVPANSLVLDYAPPIDEVFKSCSWKAVNIDSHNSYALLVADQQLKKYKTYVDSNANGVINTDSNEMIEATFNTSIRIEANETNESGASFKYWKRYLLDSKGKRSGNGEIFSNMRSISVKVTFDSYFEPVYAETTDTYFTNVQDAVYTREKSTDDNGVVYDYVYADFLLQYDTLEGNDTFKNIVASNPGKIKFGVILEMDYNYTYKPTAENPDFTAPTTNNDLLKETIKNLNTGLDEHGHNSGWNATSNSQLDQYNYYYNLYDLTDKASNLSVFGRYDYYFKFANTEANRARVYNAYSYIIIYNDNNQIEQIIVSNPKTLSIYATGIKNDGSTSEKIDTTESV